MPQDTVTRVPNRSCTSPDGMLQKLPMLEAMAREATCVCEYPSVSCSDCEYSGYAYIAPPQISATSDAMTTSHRETTTGGLAGNAMAAANPQRRHEALRHRGHAIPHIRLFKREKCDILVFLLLYYTLGS